MLKKAVMYGAGNIGRGFIAQLFNLSGYETVFIDVNEELVNGINKDREYPLFITNGDDYLKTSVDNVRAVNGNDTDKVAQEIATADIMATAVGVNILKFIAKPISLGVRARLMSNNNNPLNIIVCENKIDANIYLHDLIESELNDSEKLYFNKNFGFVEASIGRMVPASPDDIKAKYPLGVCVEKFCTLPVDKDAFKGEIPEIKNMVPFSPFELFIQRKLYMHNMSHALCAYLGYLKGYKYIWQAASDINIRYIALSALIEASQALSAEHNTDIRPLIEHSFDLLSRYDNKLLGDTIARVGFDTKRKLSAADRIPGAVKICLKNNISPDYITIALAAGLLFAPEGDSSSAEVRSYTIEKGVREALEKYCEITDKEIVLRTERLYNALAADADITINNVIKQSNL